MFLAVTASLRWLNNVVGVYFFQVSLLLIASGIGPCFPLAGGSLEHLKNLKNGLVLFLGQKIT